MKIEKIQKNKGKQPQMTGLTEMKTVRTAVYARVSTDMDIQKSSLEEQMKSFKAKIAEHPGWVLVDIYTDEGISGTKVKNRKSFQRMIKDCEEGKIDYILAKSISRFARNTVECLNYVRYLQSLGVQLYFEKENIDTGIAVSEMILTVMAAFAQEESRVTSENLKWGIRKRFEKGISRWTPTYGYRQDENGAIVVEPFEAEVVKTIFKMYQHGISAPEIIEQLNALGIKSARDCKWTKTALKYILQNEKYVGDMRLQKWVSIDHISHKSIPNDSTVIPSYYVENALTPIVDRHTFQQVQRILELKSPHGEYCRYPYIDTIFVCPICGKKLIPQIMHTQVQKRALCCFGEDGCQGYSIKTYLVDSALLEAYNTLSLSDYDKEEKTAELLRMEKIKEESPTMTSVQYYWLDDLVERIEFKDNTLQVYWKCGLTSSVEMNIPTNEEPTHVAELYRRFRTRLQTGEYRPAKPKSVTERVLAETHALNSADTVSEEALATV